MEEWGRCGAKGSRAQPRSAPVRERPRPLVRGPRKAQFRPAPVRERPAGVVSPVRREMFLIDVKGLYRRNPWVIKRKAVRANLFYVLAFVPDVGQNRFFIYSSAGGSREENTE